VQSFDLAFALHRTGAVAALEGPRRLIEQLLFPRVNLIGVNLITLGQGVTVSCSRNASSAIFAFSAASILRLVLFVIFRSVCCDGTAPNPISQPVPISGSTSSWGFNNGAVNRQTASQSVRSSK